MTKIRGLAWDDEPAEYMMALKKYLLPNSIELEICDDADSFSEQFLRDKPDFVVLDIFDDKNQKGAVGADLARRVSAAMRSEPWYPIIVLTAKAGQLNENALNLPDNATLKFKNTAVWVARYIREELRLRGVFVERQKVFLIHKSPLGIDRLKQRLSERKVGWHELNLANIRGEVAGGVLAKMNECASIIAVCSPEIESTSGSSLPDQALMLAIGMALGLPRGVERLVLLKQERTEIPVSLEALNVLPFKDTIFDVLDETEAKLQAIGVAIGEDT